MPDKIPPKYEIRGKTPPKEETAIPDKALLKKIIDERKILEREKAEWEATLKKFQAYQDSIKDLEGKRKVIENETKNLISEKDKLNRILNGLKNAVERDRDISDDIEFIHCGVSVGFSIRDEAEKMGIGNKEYRIVKA